MTLRLLIDEDVSYRVAEGLRGEGIDAVSVHELGRGNQAITDEEQLELALDERRVLVTFNRADFQAIDGQWRALGRSHLGIIWCIEASILRREIGGLIKTLCAMAERFDSLEGLCLPLTRAQES
jgi:predicted nuclease of predicted toxin-antitoxin system